MTNEEMVQHLERIIDNSIVEDWYVDGNGEEHSVYIIDAEIAAEKVVQFLSDNNLLTKLETKLV